MGTHTIEMSRQEQQRAIAIARELAFEFDRVGPGCDERNEFCHELVEPYRASGLVGIAVPKRFGGGGADILTLAQISRELAKGDPACALAFNMHQTMVGIFRGLLSEEMQARWFPPIAQERKILCGPFSEERAGFAGLADTTATPDGHGGYIIDGTKTWATLCLAADLISFNASVVDEDGELPADHLAHARSEHVFCVDMRTPGIRVEETWDTLGMRATGTHSVHFERVSVPADAIVGTFRGGLYGEFEWAALTFAGCYLGLGEKAYAHAVRTLRRKSLGATLEGADVTLKDVGYVQNGVGRMKTLNEVSERVLRSTAQFLVDGEDAGMDVMARLAHIDLVKVVATENALDLVDQAMRLVGGSTYRRGDLLERLFRDARSGPMHPLTTDQEYSLLGKLELGLLDEPAPETAAPTNGAAAQKPETVLA